MAKLRRLIRADGNAGGVEDLAVIERDEEGCGGIAHVVAHAAGADAEAIGGARDVADQPVLVAAGDGHAGGELGIVGKAHGVQGISGDGPYWADCGSGVRELHQ